MAEGPQPTDVKEKAMDAMEVVGSLEAMIRDAKSVPLSASVVVPKEQAMRLVTELRAALPKETDEAKAVLSEREQMLEQARSEAGEILAKARRDRAAMLAETDVMQAAQQEAKRLLAEAETQANKLRMQADDYVDAKLANFEILLNKILRTVNRGREQLRRRLEAAQDELPPLSLEDSGEISGPIRIDDASSQG